MASSPQVAFIHDWLVVRGGAERLLEAALVLAPGAPVFTSVYRPERFADSIISQHPVKASFIDRLPLARRKHSWFFPLMPLAVEQHDLRGFPLLVSISHAAAHGALARPDQRHVSYLLSPARYLWHLYQDYLDDNRLRTKPHGWIVRWMVHRLRVWDFNAAQRVDHQVAASQWIADCAWRAYRRKSEVIYPPVEIDRFEPQARREEYYLCVARFATYKKIPLIVKAFTRLGYPLIVVGDGPDYRQAAEIAGPNVRLTGYQPDEVVAELMSKARAFVYMAEEDFGMAVVEAQAAGCPVIAYRGGGAGETVIPGETGWLVPEQTVESLIESVREFEENRPQFELDCLRGNAERFSKERFQKAFAAMLEEQAQIQYKNRYVYKA